VDLLLFSDWHSFSSRLAFIEEAQVSSGCMLGLIEMNRIQPATSNKQRVTLINQY